MSKAILVMDMPDSCDVCAFTDMVNSKIFCGAPGGGELADDYIACRPDWCPLHEMPERAKHPDYCDNGRYDKGWNACLDEILKGGE